MDDRSNSSKSSRSPGIGNTFQSAGSFGSGNPAATQKESKPHGGSSGSNESHKTLAVPF
jgi:hypothetical protein